MKLRSNHPSAKVLLVVTSPLWLPLAGLVALDLALQKADRRKGDREVFAWWPVECEGSTVWLERVRKVYPIDPNHVGHRYEAIAPSMEPAIVRAQVGASGTVAAEVR